VATASTPWPATTDTGNSRSVGKPKSADRRMDTLTPLTDSSAVPTH
jgi:hypothetical protein